MTLECCPKYKWNHLWPQNHLVWVELEVALAFLTLKPVVWYWSQAVTAHPRLL